MKNYIPKSNKSKVIQKLINEALDILESVGVPVNTKTVRSQERMAMCFLAVAGVSREWKEVIGKGDARYLKTREIISYVNKNFQEKISSGSYDDIRRKDLKFLVLADLVINSGDNPSAATNDPTRGYSLQEDFRNLIANYNTKDWQSKLKLFNNNRPNLAEILARKRNIKTIPVMLPGGKPIELSIGEHNLLQKQIIEEFLPRFGSDCEVLYIGDTANKILHIEREELEKLNFFELSHEELPDVIAYSRKKNWLYLIEAVHSSGPMNETRVFELKKLLEKCSAEIIYVTAFLSRAEFRKWALDIAWETEAWVADNPDHLIHFNGHKFLGAY
jgi:hypothetical protein